MIITFKKKKKRFVFSFKKTETNSKPRSNNRYEVILNQYGDDYQTVFGRRQFPDGSQWVTDAKTGEIIFLDKSVRYLGESKGRHFYLAEKHKLLLTDKAHPSFE